MKIKFRHQQRLEERSSSIQVCESIKFEMNNALSNGNHQAARIAAMDLYHVATIALRDKVGGTTNFRGYLNYSRKVA